MWNKILTYLIILYPLSLFSVYTKHLAQLDIMLFIIIYLFINDNTVYLPLSLSAVSRTADDTYFKLFKETSG